MNGKLSLLVAFALGFQAYFSRSLSPSGAIAAFCVGFLTISGPLNTFGVSLIVFYLVGSRATKVGNRRKAKLEHGYHEAGYRDASQVLSNSFTALVAAFLWNASFAPNSFHAQLIKRLIDFDPDPALVPYPDGNWCPVSESRSRPLLLATLGFFACCLGDTLASEIGILAQATPYLITTLKPVPPGTNGGISPIGTLASAAGGLIMGITLFLSLVVENAVCRLQWRDHVLVLPALGAFSGFFGSAIDSLLGATFESSKYSDEKKIIVKPDFKGPARTISGLNVLSGNQVNVLSSLFTSIIAANM